MLTVHQILDGKGRHIWSVSPPTSVLEALTLMAEKNVGALLVLDGEKLAGIFSERDYARKVILKGRTSRDLAVSEIMTPGVITVRPDDSVDECMRIMSRKHVRHLPVLEGERVVGVISIGDVVTGIIDEQKSTIDHLSGYITGQR